MTTPASTRESDRAAPRTEPTPSRTTVYARAGDEIIVRGTTVGAVTRDGEIVGVHHRDGSPPYDVRWVEDGRVTLYFPGPDAYVRHLARAPVSKDTITNVPSAPVTPQAGDDHVRTD
ncbi:DUF1918 domain-containing protein [Streptomyces aureus]|uniref:DUF1918 domain-containing protein n=1 Tax=Streptomyces aureus TaxID=193461 RepID=UPI00361271FD